MRAAPYSRQRLATATLASLILLASIISFVAGVHANQRKRERPIMMDSNGSGSELFVLDAGAVVHELHVSDGGLQEHRIIALPSGLAAADMTYASSRGQDVLLIAGAESGQGVVLMYSLDGKRMKSWNLQNVCSGIDFSAASHAGYVATSDSNEIYELDVLETEVTYVTRMADATKLGPLAFDDTRKDIYVADVAAGRVYQYSMATKAGKVLVGDLSAPTALTFDPETRQLFIADPGRRAILTVDTNSKNPTLAPLASDSLKAPYGMALLSKNRIAVADYGANSIAVFSSKGALLFHSP